MADIFSRPIQIDAELSPQGTLSAELTPNETLDGELSIPREVIGNYETLRNKPSINDVELTGNKSSSDLGLASATHTHTTDEITDFPTLAEVATSGDYDDLSNKPNLSEVATSGDYDDLSNRPNIPANTSDLTNDSGFISQETDPTVPAWAKAPAKPTYTAQEVGALPDDTVIPTKLSELTNDDGFLKVTDLGEIDGDQYEWDIEEFLNMLTETGSYIFLWDEFKYWVNIEAVEIDGVTTVEQIFWGTEEGPSSTSYRSLIIESGEVINADTITYLTFQEANSVFSRNTHTHVRLVTQSQSIWDYCNVVANQNNMPIVIYFDLSSNKTYVIETYAGYRQPIYKMQRVTEMNDTSCFYQRSSYYYSSAEHWRDWYKFTGTVFDPSGR